MTIDQFREAYGQQFYGFINSELGQALITVLEKNDPVTLVSHQPQEVQKVMAEMYFWQTTGWRACVETIAKKLIVRDGQAQSEIESTYQSDELPVTLPEATPPPPSPPPRTIKRKKSRK